MKNKWVMVMILLGMFVFAFGSADSMAATYRIFGQYDEGGTQYSDVDENGYTYVQFDSVVPAYVYGNITITYTNPDKIECVSVEETPYDWGFWVWWTTAADKPAYGGGGTLYKYTSNEGEWAQQWAAWYGEGVAGPSGSIAGSEIVDSNDVGVVRFYTSTYANYSFTKPLRLGFRLKPGVSGSVDVSFKIYSNSLTGYNWKWASLVGQVDEYQIIAKSSALTFEEAVAEKLVKIAELQDAIIEGWEGNIDKSEKNKLLADIKNVIERLEEQVFKKFEHAAEFEAAGKTKQAYQLYVSVKDAFVKERAKMNTVLEFVGENLPGNEQLINEINKLEDAIEAAIDEKL